MEKSYLQRDEVVEYIYEGKHYIESIERLWYRVAKPGTLIGGSIDTSDIDLKFLGRGGTFNQCKEIYSSTIEVGELYDAITNGLGYITCTENLQFLLSNKDDYSSVTTKDLKISDVVVLGNNYIYFGEKDYDNGWSLKNYFDYGSAISTINSNLVEEGEKFLSYVRGEDITKLEVLQEVYRTGCREKKENFLQGLIINKDSRFGSNFIITGGIEESLILIRIFASLGYHCSINRTNNPKELFISSDSFINPYLSNFYNPGKSIIPTVANMTGSLKVNSSNSNLKDLVPIFGVRIENTFEDFNYYVASSFLVR